MANKTNNYCVNCEHCMKRSFDPYDCLTEYYCINSAIVDVYTSGVTGKKYTKVVSCRRARLSLCKGIHFEPKQSVWTKLIKLFKQGETNE